MLGAALVQHRVNGLRQTLCLHPLLKRRLEVCEMVINIRTRLQSLQFRLQNRVDNYPFCRFHAAVEVNCGNQSLQSVGEKSRLRATTAVLFASSQEQIASYVQ